MAEFRSVMFLTCENPFSNREILLSITLESREQLPRQLTIVCIQRAKENIQELQEFRAEIDMTLPVNRHSLLSIA